MASLFKMLVYFLVPLLSLARSRQAGRMHSASSKESLIKTDILQGHDFKASPERNRRCRKGCKISGEGTGNGKHIQGCKSGGGGNSVVTQVANFDSGFSRCDIADNYKETNMHVQQNKG
jgi:hypothetical protein